MNKKVLPGLLIILFAGCATTRMNQFNEFAEAGKAYIDAVEVVIEEAGNATVDADSTLLVRLRENIEYQDRVDSILKHNKILKQRLMLLRNIRRHGRLLKRYFIALSNLVNSRQPEQIAAITEELVQNLGTISDDIKDAKIGNMAVIDFTVPATKILIKNIRVKVLEVELKKHAAAIERELDLQKAALQLIADQLKTDLEAIVLNLETTEIVNTYISDKKLPSTWVKKRKEILTATVTLDAAHAAFKAAKNMKNAFIALVENKFEFSRLDTIMTDIEEIYVLVDAIITEEKPEEEE